jgi:hypothetical protein
MTTTSTPSRLTIQEQGIYGKLLAVAQARKSEGVRKPHVVVITDIGKDYDDVAAVIVLRELHRLELICLEGLITNTKPSDQRAILGRRCLDLLGLQDIPIGVGTTVNCGQFVHEFKASFMPNEGTFVPNEQYFFRDGFDLLHQVFTKAIEEGRQVDLLLISPLTDISQYATLHPETFQRGVGRIYLQGGYSVSAEGALTLRGDATNNFNDMLAAEHFHKLMEKESLPSVVYTRVAAFAAAIPAELFSDLEASQHPIGIYLQSCHVEQEVAHYNQACSDRVYKDITQTRYLEKRTTFFQEHPPGPLLSRDGTPLPLDGTSLPVGDQIKPYLIIVVYDALAALHVSGEDVVIALDVLDTQSMASQTSIHKIVGIAGLPETPNIHRQEMVLAISALMKGALFDSV